MSQSPPRLDSRSSSPEFSPLSIGEDLIPIRPAKAAGQTSLNFSGLLSPALLLHEDLRDGCGGQLWPAGMVLAKYILKDLNIIQGKVILELGAGGGLVGLAIAQALRNVGDSVKTPPIMITDLPILVSLQEKNIEINQLPSSRILSAELPWGSPLPESLPSMYRTPDIILAADCVYFEPAFPLLLETLKDLLDSGEIVDGENQDRAPPICYFCMKKRRKADMRFITTLKKKFDVREINASQEIREEGGGIYLYTVQRRGGNSTG